MGGWWFTAFMIGIQPPLQCACQLVVMVTRQVIEPRKWNPVMKRGRWVHLKGVAGAGEDAAQGVHVTWSINIHRRMC